MRDLHPILKLSIYDFSITIFFVFFSVCIIEKRKSKNEINLRICKQLTNHSIEISKSNNETFESFLGSTKYLKKNVINYTTITNRRITPQADFRFIVFSSSMGTEF